MTRHLLLAVALAASLVGEAPAAPTSERVVNPPLPAAERGPRGNLLWTVPLKTLSATRERPIFRPSRRPPATPVAASEAPRLAPVSEPPRLALVGTVAGPGEGIAIFVNPSTRDVLRLRTGEGHEGWIVREVRGREVVLQHAQETVTFALPSPTEEQK